MKKIIYVRPTELTINKFPEYFTKDKVYKVDKTAMLRENVVFTDLDDGTYLPSILKYFTLIIGKPKVGGE